jgi:hypothetical protein
VRRERRYVASFGAFLFALCRCLFRPTCPHRFSGYVCPLLGSQIGGSFQPADPALSTEEFQGFHGKSIAFFHV